MFTVHSTGLMKKKFKKCLASIFHGLKQFRLSSEVWAIVSFSNHFLILFHSLSLNDFYLIDALKGATTFSRTLLRKFKYYTLLTVLMLHFSLFCLMSFCYMLYNRSGVSQFHNHFTRVTDGQ